MKKEEALRELEIIKSRFERIESALLQPQFEDLADLCPNCKEPIGDCACKRNKCHNCGDPVGNITFTLCDKCWDDKSEPELVTPDGIGFRQVKAFGYANVYGIVNDKKVLRWNPLRDEWYISFKDGNHTTYNHPLEKTTFGELEDGDVFCDNADALNNISNYNIKLVHNKCIFWNSKMLPYYYSILDNNCIVHKVMPK